MSDPFVGEIRMFGGNFAPAGWAFCDGSLQPIAQYEVLYTLLGTTFGGDGQQTFGLPDLRGRLPLHSGSGLEQNVVMGEAGGTETVTLTTQQMPAHSHQLMGSSTGTVSSPGNAVFGTWNDSQYSSGDPKTASLLPSAVGSAGSNWPHENRSPYLAVSFIISLFGIFPSQT
jgi:microcystin-dependent protein